MQPIGPVWPVCFHSPACSGHSFPPGYFAVRRTLPHPTNSIAGLHVPIFRRQTSADPACMHRSSRFSERSSLYAEPPVSNTLNVRVPKSLVASGRVIFHRTDGRAIRRHTHPFGYLVSDRRMEQTCCNTCFATPFRFPIFLQDPLSGFDTSSGPYAPTGFSPLSAPDFFILPARLLHSAPGAQSGRASRRASFPDGFHRFSSRPIRHDLALSRLGFDSAWIRHDPYCNGSHLFFTASESRPHRLPSVASGRHHSSCRFIRLLRPRSIIRPCPARLRFMGTAL